MTPIQALGGVLVPSISIALTLVFYMNRHRTRHLKLRYLYERLCVCLADDQVGARRDEIDASLHSRFPPQASYFTAIEFLEEPGSNGRRLMSQLDRLSPSLFAGSMIKLVIISLFAALAIIVAVLTLVPTIPAAAAFAKANLVEVLILTGVFGVLCSFGCIFFMYKIYFDRNLEDVKIVAQRWALWGVGPNGRPNGRTIITANDDPDYIGLC